MIKTINAIDFCNNIRAKLVDKNNNIFNIDSNDIGYIVTGAFSFLVNAFDDKQKHHQFIVTNVGNNEKSELPASFYAEKIVIAYSYGCCNIINSKKL